MPDAPPSPPISLPVPRRRFPVWFGPAVVALVAWIGGAHQPGPLLVYPETRSLPFAWYGLEQILAVFITLAALSAGAAVVAGRLLPYRVALRAVCDARFPLALAAAFASHQVMRGFLPESIIGWPRGPAVHLAPFQILWLVVATLAIASMLLRVAVGYYRLLSIAVPTRGRCVAALTVALLLGEVTAQMASHLLLRLFPWPP